MELEYKFKYYVVEFLEKPYSTIDLAVCVPRQWIELGYKKALETRAAYPAEYSPSTRESVKKKYLVQEDWRYYRVKLQYGSENEAVTKRKRRSSHHSSSPTLATTKKPTKIPLLGSNRCESVRASIKQPGPFIPLEKILTEFPKVIETSKPVSEMPNHLSESPKNLNENKLVSTDRDCSNQKQNDTLEVEMSTVINNTVEQTVLESSAEKVSSLIPLSQSNQPLPGTNEENLPIVIIDSQNQKLQEVDMRKKDLLNTIGKRPDCRNSSTSSAAELSLKSKRKRDKPSNHQRKNPRYLPFSNYTYPDIIKKKQMAYNCNEVYGTDLCSSSPINPINPPAQNIPEESRSLSDQTQQHQSPSRDTDFLHHSSQSQNRPEPSSVRVQILENKVIVPGYSTAENPSPQVPPNISHNNQLLRVNTPILYNDEHQRQITLEKSMQSYDNDTQQICPDITTINTSSALKRLRNMIAQYSQSSSHAHTEPLDTTNEVHMYPEPCVQEMPTEEMPTEEMPTEEMSTEEIPTEEIPVEKMTEDDYIEPAACPGNSTEQQSKDNSNLLGPRYTLPEVKLIVEQSIIKVFRNIVVNMQLTFNDFLVNNNTSRPFNQACTEIMRSVDRFFIVQKDNAAESVPQKQPVEPANNENKKSNNVEPDNAAAAADDDDSDDDDDDNDFGVDNKNKTDNDENDDVYYEPQKKKRGSKRTFVLPAEYDPHNSRWTLKYQVIKPGVVELMPHSKIYISSLRLANCKRVAKDYKTLGRMLLAEIFSQNALSVCSLTGAKANAFDVHKSDIRPGLDKEARSVLLTYVENYGRKQGWGACDTHSVVNSLRSKIQEMRSKYGLTVES